ncbi:MAG: DUF4153 domain-containing protein [Bacilli bacterium]|nr:DUF4153 domain-containing protein [Bacilli bacterium]
MDGLFNFKNKTLLTMKEYYISILLFILATIIMMIAIWADYNGIYIKDSIIKLIPTLIYGAIIALIINSIINRIGDIKKKISNLLYLLIPLLMVIVYYIILTDINMFSSLLNYLILCLLSSILFLVIPFIGKEEDSDYYSYKVIISLMITGICYLLLIFGLIFIIQSTTVLFEASINEYVYAEIAVFILGFIMPTLFLAIIPSSELERKEYPDVIKKIIMYIIYPILSLFTVVLYTYFIKVLIELKWPSNVLGDLVITYSFISIIVLYFTYKMKNEDKWSNKFIKIYPWVLIIPMIMMLISFIIRINAYGFTEPRYYALLHFVFIILSIFIIKIKNKVKYIPLILSVLLFISIFGPLSATNVSKICQEKRLEKILISNNMLKDNKIKINYNLEEKEKNKIINILRYFDQNHNFNDIDYLPNNFEINKMEEVFGFVCNETNS